MREPVRSDADARRRYLGYLTRSLQCVTTSAIWRVGKGNDPDEWIALTTPGMIVLPRGTGESSPLYMRATQTFHYEDHSRFQGERKVATDEYAYTLYEDEELGSELLSWHWQPKPGHEDPHLHVGFPHPNEPQSTKWHVPSGRVAFEQVLVFAIRELGVEPVGGHDEAMEILNDALVRFRTYASWGVDSRERND